MKKNKRWNLNQLNQKSAESIEKEGYKITEFGLKIMKALEEGKRIEDVIKE